MASVLLKVVLGIFVVIGTLSRPSEKSCGPLQITNNTKVTAIFGGRGVLIPCGTHQKIAFCMDGEWYPSSIKCSEGRNDGQPKMKDFNQHNAPSNIQGSPYLLGTRQKRNTGKYQDIRRSVKIQRKIRAGLLETTIDTSIPSIYSAHPLGNVYLACRIENLGSQSVTWIRKKDNNVLAIDTIVIKKDQRLLPSYEENTQTWLLGIQGVRESDQGFYECQVSTRPPQKRIVKLDVIPADQPLQGPVQADHHDLEFVLKNISAIWEEIHEVRDEINHHLHNDHNEDNHDKVLKEVETLHHEHHVHHLHHPHPGHNEHHDTELLQHLEEVHHHSDDHSEDQTVHSHLHGHGHSHDHHHGMEEGEHDHEDHDHLHGSEEDDEDHDHHGEEDDDSSEEDEHDHHHHHGHEHEHEHDHDHEHEHDHDHEHEHDHHHVSHDQDHHHEGDDAHHAQYHDHGDAHDSHGLHSHEDEHEYGHEHGHDHEDEHHHDDHHESSSGSSHSGRRGKSHKRDPWNHANCVLKPHAGDSNSHVNGSIVISQRKDKKGPIYFDLHIRGIDVATTGKTHGFHVHEQGVTDGDCTSTGGHFNPDQVVHGAHEDDERHAGDLGNIEFNDDGELHGYIMADDRLSFEGTHNIIGKAIVVHSGGDEHGSGGMMLACCTVALTTDHH